MPRTEIQVMTRPPPDVALDLAIRPQPDDTTCGPTCLYAICSILPGIVTYDANLLVIEPARPATGSGSSG